MCTCTYVQPILISNPKSNYKELDKTRWTFFRVQLVFECDFQISWSLGPWDLGSEGRWDLGTIGPWDHQEGCQMTIEFIHEDNFSKQCCSCV